MNDRKLSLAAGMTIVAALLAALPSHAGAQLRPAPQRVLSRGATSPVRTQASDPARHGDRVLYGRIEAIRGSALVVRARSGRLFRVDASEALRTDTYSAPLFVGKIVVIDGYDGAKALHATSVMRMGNLDAGTPPDR